MNAIVSNLSPEGFEFLRRHVYQGSGIVVQPEQQYLVEARLAPLARDNGLGSLDDLCAALRDASGNGLHDRVLEAMTTNETYFFREPAQFEGLRSAILPQLIRARQDTRKLRFWSAAASTGQEAYSLAMLLLEMGLDDWHIDILGTDLSRAVLRRAEDGRYSQLEVNRGLPAGLLIKYFRRASLEWELRTEVRRMARFRPFDLRSSMHAMGPFDVVFCRNVLIYLDLATRKQILDEIHGSLFRGGTLLLGTTEAGLPPGDRYRRESAGSAVVYVAQ
jgi:chemotaxis protein methyltransferase CheR